MNNAASSNKDGALLGEVAGESFFQNCLVSGYLVVRMVGGAMLRVKLSVPFFLSIFICLFIHLRLASFDRKRFVTSIGHKFRTTAIWQV